MAADAIRHPHTPLSRIHTHIRSFVAPANPVGRPLILQHIYNLCKDNLIPPAGRTEHTPPFMLLTPSEAPTCTRQRQQLRLSPALPASPGLGSADWYSSARSWSWRNIWSVGSKAQWNVRVKPPAVLWRLHPYRIISLLRAPTRSLACLPLTALTVSMNRGGVLKTSALCQWYWTAGH